MDIPSSCFEPEFRHRLRARARLLVLLHFDPSRHGSDREAFVDDLIAAADRRIWGKDEPDRPIVYWFSYYVAVINNIVRQTSRDAGRDPLALPGGQDDDQNDEHADRRFGSDPGFEERIVFRDFIEATLRSFCRDNTFRMHAEHLDPKSFARHLLRKFALGMTLREYCTAYADAPARSTFSRWIVEFRRYALERWHEARAEAPAAEEGTEHEKRHTR